MNLKAKEKELKSSSGITMVSLVVSIIILVILAGILIFSITSENGVVGKATDSKIMTELTQLQECIDKYKASGEGKRLANGDFSGTMSNDDLAANGIITKVVTTEEDQNSSSLHLGIVTGDGIKALKSSTGIGKNIPTNLDSLQKNDSQEAILNQSMQKAFSDVYAIDLTDNTLYYINKDIWSVDGMVEVATVIDKSGQIETNSPRMSMTNSGNSNFTIAIKKTSGELINNIGPNQYYISTSGNALTGGSWKTYENNKSFNVSNVTEFYIFVKQVTDDNGNKSIPADGATGGTIKTINGETYHKYGPYDS